MSTLYNSGKKARSKSPEMKPGKEGQTRQLLKSDQEGEVEEGPGPGSC